MQELLTDKFNATELLAQLKKWSESKEFEPIEPIQLSLSPLSLSPLSPLPFSESEESFEKFLDTIDTVEQYFYLFINTDSEYMIKMDIAIKEEVKIAVLKATDPDNIWIEYMVKGTTFCVLSGKEMIYQCDKKFWEMLKQFKYIEVDASNQTSGWEFYDC